MAIRQPTLALQNDLRGTVGAEADQATRDVTGRWVDGWDTLGPLYAGAVAGVTASAVAAGVWPGPWDLARDPQLAAATRQAQTTAATLAGQSVDTTTTSASSAVQVTVDAEPQIMASQLPAAEQANAAAAFTAAVTPAALAALLTAVTANLPSLRAPIIRAAVDGAHRAVVQGVPVTTGTPQAAAQRLVGNIERGFLAGLTSAIAAARTETLDAYRTAARRVHSANALWLDGWYWQSRLSPSTCPSCWALHGTFHPVAEQGPEDHRNGHCSRIPKLRPWVTLGLGQREPGDAIPDAETAFNALPEADQLQVMGPARLALLRSGDIRWDDLAVRKPSTSWRAAYQPRTVTDLRSLARRRASAAV